MRRQSTRRTRDLDRSTPRRSRDGQSKAEDEQLNYVAQKPVGNVRLVVWGHSDQAGGTELAYIVARAFIEIGCPIDSVVLVSPNQEQMERINASNNIQIHNFYLAPQGLWLEKNEDGWVDGAKTFTKVFQQPYMEYGSPPHSLPNPFLSENALHSFVSDQKQSLLRRFGITSDTLFISCGEPIAVKIAKEIGCQCVTVTDHLMVETVLRVMGNHGIRDQNVLRILGILTQWDHMADEAFLTPPEFAGAEYDTYFSRGGVPCNFVGGLFYPPIPIATLRMHRPYRALRSKQMQAQMGRRKLIFVFGGGGNVWLGIYEALYEKCRNGGLKVANMKRATEGQSGLALLVPKVERRSKDGKEELTRSRKDSAFQYYYFDGESDDPEELDDPGNLMFWYAACDLFVGRGGLAAQQIFATNLSDLDHGSPEMLFVQEPGHPQIEHERIALFNLGFVHTRILEDFRRDPLGIVGDILPQLSPIKRKYRLQARFGDGMLNRVAQAIAHSYLSEGDTEMQV